MADREAKVRAILPEGFYVDSYSPGDGVTRYRFFTEPTDYFAGNGTYTALGLAEALTYARGLRDGVHRANATAYLADRKNAR